MRMWVYRPQANVVAVNTFFMSTLGSMLDPHAEYNYAKVERWVDGWNQPITGH